MSRTLSPSSKKPYGVARVTGLWGLARSSFYAARHRNRHPREEQKRGPKVLSDAELVTAIRQLLDEAVFSGEGYRRDFGIRLEDLSGEQSAAGKQLERRLRAGIAGASPKRARSRSSNPGQKR